MIDLARYSIWAGRAGLLCSFFIYIAGNQRFRDNAYVSALIILAIFAATFVPREHRQTIKTYAPIALGNTAALALLLSIVFATTVLSLLFNEEIIPGLGRLLRVSELSSAYLALAVLLLVVPNINLVAGTLRAVVGAQVQQHGRAARPGADGAPGISTGASRVRAAGPPAPAAPAPGSP